MERPLKTNSWRTWRDVSWRIIQSRLSITYLTDLPLAELVARVTKLPENSIILYVWQQSATRTGIVESPEILAGVARSARVPMYGLTGTSVGRGVVGGYVATVGGNVTRLAELTRRLANGAQATDIPVEGAPVVPMFDWRQLQRWNVSENLLPSGSIVLYRQPTMWQQYRWRIVAAIILFILQGSLIAALLVERQRGRRSQRELQEYKGQLENLVQTRTAEVVQARDQAEAANRAKSVFLATMSHELRTPLNAILGYSNLLRAHSDSEPQRRELDIINRSGEHLLALINEVLDMAKIEAGHAVLETAPCDIRILVEDVAELMRVRIAEKHVALKLVNGGASPVYARVDAAKLREVLINLLGNAVKYTELGSITLRFEAQPVDGGDRLLLRFAVEDTGIGIAPEDQERIFKPFEQVARGTYQKGTGLGLAITQQLVELMGGSIKVESTVGKGSCFRVDLVTERTQEPEPRSAVTWGRGRIPVLEEGQPEYRILIVEDELENRILLDRLLTEAGFEVRVAENGEQGIEGFREWRPQLIWMDLRMGAIEWHRGNATDQKA